MFDKIQRWIYAIENNQVLSAIKKGFMLLIPVVLTGSFSLLLSNFPVAAYQDWLASFGGGALLALLGFIFDATTGFVSLYLVMAISYFYSGVFAGSNFTLRVMAMIASVACFIASFGGMSGSLELSCFGTVGVFSAMLCAIIATRLFFALDLRRFKQFRSYVAGNDIHYHSSISAVVPMVVSVALFAAGDLAMVQCLGVGNLNDLISGILAHAFNHFYGEPGNGLLFLLLLNLLWFFGVHGGNALDPVAQTIFAAGENASGMIISKSFLDNFASIGGSGASLCLVIALCLLTRNRSNRQLAYSAVPLALFNINEILVFGLPIVLNPVLIIPFVLTPLVSMLIAYGAVWLGWMPLGVQSVSWTTPVFFSGYLATGSWRGAAVQLLILAVGTLIYLPFVHLAERLQEGKSTYLLSELTEHFRTAEKTGSRSAYLGRHDHLGIMAKALVSQLRSDMAQKRITVYYQPQVDEQGQMVGAEALLRWRYSGENVYPPLIVALAQEDGCFEELTWAILATVCEDIQILKTQLGPDLAISANIIAEQLEDAQMVQQVMAMAKNYDVGGQLVLEVTEETSLLQFTHIGEHIEQLASAGIMLAIDDFSMGQTSLNYLRDNNFRYVKLDGSLVRQVTDNARCREIIGSIVTLGNNLGFQVVAEWVENEAIRDHLLTLGCRVYQGYLFSPAVPLEELITFAEKRAKKTRNPSETK